MKRNEKKKNYLVEMKREKEKERKMRGKEIN